MKIKEIHYLKNNNEYGTGIYFILENGEILEQLSTDPIMPHKKVNYLPNNIEL